MTVQRYLFPVLFCLTLGLAPFTPEPHLFGKIRWVAGGAVGMGPMDWFDLVMHGSPFLLLAGTAIAHFLEISRGTAKDKVIDPAE